MTDLWIPPTVSRELNDHVREVAAVTLGMFTFDGPVCGVWNPELRRIDEFLRLGRAREKAMAPGVMPGFFHLIRVNPGAPLSVTPLTGPSGEFVEPSLAMLENLKAADLQNAAVVRERKRQDRLREESKRRAKENDRTVRREEIMDRWKSGTQIRVP